MAPGVARVVRLARLLAGAGVVHIEAAARGTERDRVGEGVVLGNTGCRRRHRPGDRRRCRVGAAGRVDRTSAERVRPCRQAVVGARRSARVEADGVQRALEHRSDLRGRERERGIRLSRPVGGVAGHRRVRNGRIGRAGRREPEAEGRAGEPRGLGVVEERVLRQDIGRPRSETRCGPHGRRKGRMVVARRGRSLTSRQAADQARAVVHREVAAEVEDGICGDRYVECEIVGSHVLDPELGRLRRARRAGGRLRERHERPAVLGQDDVCLPVAGDVADRHRAVPVVGSAVFGRHREETVVELTQLSEVARVMGNLDQVGPPVGVQVARLEVPLAEPGVRVGIGQGPVARLREDLRADCVGDDVGPAVARHVSEHDVVAAVVAVVAALREATRSVLGEDVGPVVVRGAGDDVGSPVARHVADRDVPVAGRADGRGRREAGGAAVPEDADPSVVGMRDDVPT